VARRFGYPIGGRIADPFKPRLLFQGDEMRGVRRSMGLDQAEYGVWQARGCGCGRPGRKCRQSQNGATGGQAGGRFFCLKTSAARPAVPSATELKLRLVPLGFWPRAFEDFFLERRRVIVRALGRKPNVKAGGDL
jgi:hypothetical protein